MGIYHCDCGETLCSESFSCKECGCNAGDGTILCEDCAENHCKKDAEKTYGMYFDNGKHDRPRVVQDPVLRKLLEGYLAGSNDRGEAADAKNSDEEQDSDQQDDGVSPPPAKKQSLSP
ncbi:hypothetical protein HDU98_009360 [Podochytrium sp. JEL0797]|nr:hypothetical protein HDU98_009360 [Podochytrium sp. JEL0797]